MELQAAIDSIRAVWSDRHVCQVAREFLAECKWELEVGNGWMKVPADAELLVYSAAVIVSDHGFGDHIEVIVYLGVRRSPPNLFPVHGVLRLYLNPAGQMITEDRYSLAEWTNNDTESDAAPDVVDDPLAWDCSSLIGRTVGEVLATLGLRAGECRVFQEPPAVGRGLTWDGPTGLRIQVWVPRRAGIFRLPPSWTPAEFLTLRAVGIIIVQHQAPLSEPTPERPGKVVPSRSREWWAGGSRFRPESQSN